MELQHMGWERAKEAIFNINNQQLKIVKKMPIYYDFLANKIYKGGNVGTIKFGKKKK